MSKVELFVLIILLLATIGMIFWGFRHPRKGGQWQCLNNSVWIEKYNSCLNKEQLQLLEFNSPPLK